MHASNGWKSSSLSDYHRFPANSLTLFALIVAVPESAWEIEITVHLPQWEALLDRSAGVLIKSRSHHSDTPTCEYKLETCIIRPLSDHPNLPTSQNGKTHFHILRGMQLTKHFFPLLNNGFLSLQGILELWWNFQPIQNRKMGLLRFGRNHSKLYLKSVIYCITLFSS